MTSPKSSTPLIGNVSRRRILTGTAGMAAILASGRAPLFAQATPKKLDFANILGAPDVGGAG